VIGYAEFQKDRPEGGGGDQRSGIPCGGKGKKMGAMFAGIIMRRNLRSSTPEVSEEWVPAYGIGAVTGRLLFRNQRGLGELCKQRDGRKGRHGQLKKERARPGHVPTVRAWKRKISRRIRGKKSGISP